MSITSRTETGRRYGPAATATMTVAPFVVLVALGLVSAWVLLPAFVVVLVMAVRRMVPGAAVWAVGIAALLSVVLPLVFLASASDTTQLTDSGGAVTVER